MPRVRRTGMITRLGGVLLAASLLAGCGAAATTAADAPVSASGTPATSGSATTAGNRALALAESHRLLTVLSPPSGGRVVASAPAASLRDQAWGMSPSDSSLSRHAWWTVPMAPTVFVAWLREQHVAGLTSSDGGSVGGTGIGTIDITNFTGDSTAAYSAPTLSFGYVPHAGGVAVRLDTFLAARYARTTYLATDTTRVLIRTVTTYADGRRRTTRGRTVSDPAQVRRLVAAANGLYGIVTVPNIFHCPMMLSTTTATAVFSGPSGTYAVSGPSTTCGAVLSVRHDGRLVPPALDPGQGWFPLLGI
ncbi:hypothetical protein GCM10028801_40280 [Nocardioides maradonensis]